MGFILGNATTYACDKALFSKLGLKQFSIADQTERFVGEYKLPQEEVGSVKIWVTCMPSQFWRFEIVNTSNECYEVSAGSGSLSDYWPSIELILISLLRVERKS